MNHSQFYFISQGATRDWCKKVPNMHEFHCQTIGRCHALPNTAVFQVHHEFVTAHDPSCSFVFVAGAFAETNPSEDCSQICNGSRMITYAVSQKSVLASCYIQDYLSLYIYK